MRGDSAIGTAVVAALGDFEIRCVRRGGKDPPAAQGKGVLFGESLHLAVALQGIGQQVGNLPVGADPDRHVHLRHLLLDLLAVPFRQASSYYQRPETALLFQAGQLEDFFNGFFFGALNKPTGIHQDGVGLLYVGAKGKAGILQAGKQHFAVHLVFRTAQTDHPDGIRHGNYSFYLVFCVKFSQGRIGMGFPDPPFHSRKQPNSRDGICPACFPVRGVQTSCPQKAAS